MLTAEKNDLLTRVGPGTPMGDYLRRYWHPIAGISEFDDKNVKPIRLFGEDLVLFKDLSGGFGLIERHCPHRRADLAHGMVEDHGLRCNYHGWCFNQAGDCIEQPYEDVARSAPAARHNVKATAYPLEAKAGMLWAYMGTGEPPLVPDWAPFSWKNGFVQVVLSEVPCNWFQAQENSIDPVHFEWMHETWGQRINNHAGPKPPRHLKLAFDEFDYGLVYKRVKEDTSEEHENWTIGRVCLWPNAFFLTEHFEWRVPIDDENMLSVTWKFTRVPREEEPYVQDSIPTWVGPTHDENGEWLKRHVLNQDFLAWAGQGRIADRTTETLGLSDQGVVLLRRRFFDELERVAAGGEPKGIIRDPSQNVAVSLPSMGLADVVEGYTKAEILADPRKRMMNTAFIFQAGQPEWVLKAFEKAIGMPASRFEDFDLGNTIKAEKTAP